MGKAVLRKTPVHKDCDLNYLAAQTDKFTGADLTEICQRAAKLAIREDIMRNIERENIRRDAEAQGVMEEDVEEEDLVPEIMPRHFEEAVRGARRSVSDRDLAQYSSYAMTMQQSRANITSGGTSLGSFAFPSNSNASQGTTSAAMEEEEEDLYS